MACRIWRPGRVSDKDLRLCQNWEFEGGPGVQDGRRRRKEGKVEDEKKNGVREIVSVLFYPHNLSGVVLTDRDFQLGSGAEVQGDGGAALQDGEAELSGMKLSKADLSPSSSN